MKNKMTINKALKITIEHYKWLEKNPTALYTDWPGIFKYETEDPLCDIAEGDCMKCPLIALWIKGSEILPKNQRIMSCLVRTSPYAIRENNKKSINEKDRDKVKESIRLIYKEAEYSLKHGIRDPDLSVFKIKRLKRGNPTRRKRKRITGRIRRSS